jgi:hypothetical protein
MLHVDLCAKAAAEAGNSIVGIMTKDAFFGLIDKAKWNNECLPEARRENINAEKRGGKCEAVPTREVMCAPLVEGVVTR